MSTRAIRNELTALVGCLDLTDVATSEVDELLEKLASGTVLAAEIHGLADVVCWRLIDVGNVIAWEHATRVARELRRTITRSR